MDMNKNKNIDIIERGGKIEERLYLYDLVIEDYNKFDRHLADKVVFKKTDLPNMDGLIERHRARYYLPAFFCRPKMRVLDFPCGSGYGFEIFREFGVQYQGMDIDALTIKYCEIIYPENADNFSIRDLKYPRLEKESFDLIACIDGIEHIEERFQVKLIQHFYKALNKNGILIISTPGKKNDTPVNRYHLSEFSRKDFEFVLGAFFNDVQIIEQDEVLHNFQETKCLYGICKKRTT